MAFAGLRPGEAVALRVGKFDPKLRKLEVDASMTGFTKTGEARTIDLPKVVAELLRHHIEETVRVASWVPVPGEWDHPEAPIFPKEDGAAIDSKNEYDSWSRRFFGPAAERAKIEGLSPNDLRHHAVAFAIGNGADVYSVQRMVGHARPSITLDVYGSLWDASAKQLAGKLDKAIRKARRELKPAEIAQLPASG